MDAKKRLAALLLAVPLATAMEGTRQWAYFDPVGLPTICMGSTKGVRIGDFRTLEECKALLTREMSDVISRVDSCRPGLPANVLAAFSDLAYNAGEHVACDPARSTAARMLRDGDIAGACRQILRWTKATIAGVKVELPGLVKRRQLEYDLCLS